MRIGSVEVWSLEKAWGSWEDVDRECGGVELGDGLRV